MFEILEHLLQIHVKQQEIVVNLTINGVADISRLIF